MSQTRIQGDENQLARAKNPSGDRASNEPASGETVSGLSGRELDAWLAVNAMKWIPVKDDWWPNAVTGGGRWNCPIEDATGWAFEYPDGVFRAGKHYCTKRLYDWRPTEDMAAAMQVVEKLGLEFTLGWLPSDSSGINWDASFGQDRDSEGGTCVYAETAPLAICLAALKAVDTSTAKPERP